MARRKKIRPAMDPRIEPRAHLRLWEPRLRRALQATEDAEVEVARTQSARADGPSARAYDVALGTLQTRRRQARAIASHVDRLRLRAGR